MLFSLTKVPYSLYGQKGIQQRINSSPATYYYYYYTHKLGHMQVCTSLQTDNHASISPLKFLTGRMPFLTPNQQRQSTITTVPKMSTFLFLFIA